MAAGEPWMAAKYFYKVQDRFPDQANPFWENSVFVIFGPPPLNTPLNTSLNIPPRDPIEEIVIWVGKILIGRPGC